MRYASRRFPIGNRDRCGGPSRSPDHADPSGIAKSHRTLWGYDHVSYCTAGYPEPGSAQSPFPISLIASLSWNREHHLNPKLQSAWFRRKDRSCAHSFHIECQREGQQRVDFVEEPLCQAAAVSVRGGGQPSKDGPLRLMWRRSAPGGGSASPISANSGRWRPIGTRLSPHSDPADAIGQVLGCA